MIELWKKKRAIFLSAASYFSFKTSFILGCALGEGDGQVLPCCPLDPTLLALKSLVADELWWGPF